MAQSEAEFDDQALLEPAGASNMEVRDPRRLWWTREIDSLMNNYAAQPAEPGHQPGDVPAVHAAWTWTCMRSRPEGRLPEMQVKQQLALDAVVAAENITDLRRGAWRRRSSRLRRATYPDRASRGWTRRLKVDLARDAHGRRGCRRLAHLITADEGRRGQGQPRSPRRAGRGARAEEKPKKTTRKKKTEETAEAKEEAAPRRPEPRRPPERRRTAQETHAQYDS